MNYNTKNGIRTPAVETILTHVGRQPDSQHGFVNTPVTRGSTVLFSTLDALEDNSIPFRYSRTGNPSARSVEEPITLLEAAAGTVLAPSGLSAVSLALMSCLSAGDEVLVTDSAYQPTRNLCNGVLKRMGISTRYYDPRIGGGIAELLRDNTRAIFIESPGSLTFEVQDLPAIAAAVRGRDIKLIADNTWATPLYYRPLELGADMVIHAGTKMIGGHSDIMFGSVSANENALEALRKTHYQLGICAAPDDCFLAARGLRTLAMRMKEHQARALELAQWLALQEGVKSVLHPALPDHPDHAIFKRDFSGSGSLFSIVLEAAPRTAIAAMTDQMRLFGMGFSWGGFESLMLPTKPHRTFQPWMDDGNIIRLHIGFEDVSELKADLADGLKRYLAATR